MPDWRLDSTSGGNNLPLNATLCAVGRPWASDTYMHCGGGAGTHTFITLDRVCEKHVLVVGGRTYERGFTINRDGMSLTMSKAIPWVGRVFVLGFGRVVRDKPPDDWFKVRPVAEHFPVANGINAGFHPYETMEAGSYARLVWPYMRNYANAGVLKYDNYGGDTRTDRRLPSVLNAWGRIGLYHALCVLSDGKVLRVHLPSGEAELEPFAVLPPEKARVFSGLGRSGLDLAPRRLYYNNLMPDGDGNLYAFPRAFGFPVLKLAAPDYNDLVSLGAATADDATAYKDPFDTASGSVAAALSSANYSIFIRLFDGRFLGFPRGNYGSGGAHTNNRFLLFDPTTATSQTLPLPPDDPDLGPVAGNERWKQPVQAADGKVYALPSMFPSNLTLIFDPETDQFDRSDFGIAYPRSDIMHTDGVPCANGKIYYCQTYGAATDTNRFLVLDTNNRTHTIEHFDLVRSTMLPFMSAMALSDGCPMFIGPAYYSYGSPYIHNLYNRMVYDPWRDTFKLYRARNMVNNVGLWDFVSYPHTDARQDANRDTDARRWELARFLLPEFSLVTATSYPGSVNSPPRIVHHYFETPPQAYPGTFYRQAFFGRCS
ncbi:MAG: hypothetical protein LBT97_02975 [Planctomycetota bacterium]|jgi:hypothetical protein|nr:hypothetical protein [Planctomycetota bacterium]